MWEKKNINTANDVNNEDTFSFVLSPLLNSLNSLRKFSSFNTSIYLNTCAEERSDLGHKRPAKRNDKQPQSQWASRWKDTTEKGLDGTPVK